LSVRLVGLGFVRAADGGTLFLDEIGDLRKSSQAALLRVLEDGEVVPVGSTRGRKVDVRVVSATNRALDDLVQSGEFRRDLLARLAGRRHVLPTLRERREDLGSILSSIVARGSAGRGSPPRLQPEAALALLHYEWPGNIRELRHAFEAASLLAGDDPIDVTHLPGGIVQPSRGEGMPAGAVAKQALFGEAAQKEIQVRLTDLLTAHGGNIAAVAAAIQTSRSHVSRWLKRFQIDVAKFLGPRRT
jgi:transcriptional regulator with PAS, ATPase and Fis domain